MAFEKAASTDFDVVIVGAGISGINFGYRLQERCPNLKYTILESRHEIGGTWSLFKYPGIRSDSDLYTFGFAWRPWEAHTAIAEGPLILDYVKESAAMYGIDKKIQYHHRVDNANFSSKEKVWTLDVTVNNEKQKKIRANFILMCTGYYDYSTPLKAPIPGIDNFKGQVIHPQFWPEDLNYKDKDVVVIGSGATAITLIPSMSPETKHITMLQRSPSYLMPLRREDPIERLIRASFSWNMSLQHKLIRWKWIAQSFLFVQFCKAFPLRARRVVGRIIKKLLPQDGSVPQDPHFNPSYNPFEQRLCFCPDADFYKALRKGEASIATDTIKNITTDTIQLESGAELHPDIIVTATGLKLKFAGGMTVSVDNKPLAIPEKFVWQGVMIEDLPNAAFVMGYVDASWTLGADATAQMMTRILNKMKKEGAVEIVPRMSAEERKTVQEKPLLRLTSTYVEKAKKDIPKTGTTGPWQPRSFYYRDLYLAWFGNIKSGLEWIRGV